jgi:hypothetical protein
MGDIKMKTALLLNVFCKQIFVVAAIALISGCATVHEMGVKKDTEHLNLDKKGLLLMSVQVTNEYKPDYQPQIIVAFVEKPNAQSKEDRHNFKTDLEGTISSSDGSRYLLRMELEPGKYVVRGASCMYQSLFLIGSCFIPIHADIVVEPNKVTYLGRVKGVMKEREDDEFRAGPLIPLVDQSVTGFSQSTFDVAITDQSSEDLKAYKSLFPVLSAVDIETRILPPFDRKRAQAWWETDGESEKATVEARAEQN